MTKKVKLEAKDVPNEVFKEKLKRFIDVEVHESSALFVQIITITDGGILQWITLDNDSEQSLFEQFIEYVDGFDVDEAIDSQRLQERYRARFTIRQSLEDFEEYQNTLKGMVHNLEVVCQP